MSFGSSFVLTLFTSDVELARRADLAGVNRIGLDLERIGKSQRQGHLKTWISDHEEGQLPAMRQALTRAQLFVRANPIHAGSRDEIDRLIGGGAQVLMLPMFTSVQEAARFIELVAGRAEVSLLVETAAAAVRLDEIARLPGIDEIHIGLNDLHLSLGLRSHFELLGSRLIDVLCNSVREAGVPLGMGGVGRVNDHRLPVASDLVYAQYARLNADRALVSRVFVSPDYTGLDLASEVALLRCRLDEWRARPDHELLAARDALRQRVAQL